VKVYVDQLDCTGSGQCELMAPAIFVVQDDGLATVIDSDGQPLPDGGAAAGVEVPSAGVALVRDVAAICPGSCIICVES
jgi:ferredoxin